MYHGHDIYISIICSPKFQISRQTKTCLIYQLNLPKMMPPFQVYLQSEHALFQSKPSNFIIHISIDCISSSLLKLFKHLGWLKNKSQSIRKRQFMAKEQNPARNDDCWGIKLSPHVFSKPTRGPRLKNRSPLSSRFTVEKKSLFLRPPPSSLGGAGGVLHGATAAAAMARPLLLPLLLRRPDDSSTTFLIILQIEFVLILFSLVNAAFCQPAQLHQPTRMLLTK